MKFAYLIMAHNRFSVLKMLLEDLDDERNDIFLHIDRKTGKYEEEEIKKCIKRANLVLIKRISVYWGHYSQIKCVVNLIKEAVSYGYHDYYHFMVGVEFPLKSQEYIHSFFEENRGYEFIGYDVVNFSDRMKYWNIWGKYARSQKKYQKMLFKWNSNILHIQEILGINRIKGKENYYKKGYAQWSITHELANFILDEFKKIKGQYYFTYCADEIFFQTIVFHSKYYDRVFDPNNEYKSSMRLTTWTDPRNQLHFSDLDELINTDKLFGRKFDGDDAENLIIQIMKKRV
ncbi:MAG: beta-1,6-N-acetylglucosaminyltransferase [Lachnospiraceae bacterium]|jgi:hypothetical protein|nr:beta-1,6-N-acetylglucosaminyltransferase [Lachnospiraceae bacterium]